MYKKKTRKKHVTATLQQGEKYFWSEAGSVNNLQTSGDI